MPGWVCTHAWWGTLDTEQGIHLAGELRWWFWQSKLLRLACHCGGKHRRHGMPCDHRPVDEACKHMKFSIFNSALQTCQAACEEHHLSPLVMNLSAPKTLSPCDKGFTAPQPCQ